MTTRSRILVTYSDVVNFLHKFRYFDDMTKEVKDMKEVLKIKSETDKVFSEHHLQLKE